MGMSGEEIEAEWPKFLEWTKKQNYRHLSGGIYLIKEWERYKGEVYGSHREEDRILPTG